MCESLCGCFEQGKVSLPPHLTHLHLAALLQSGLALDLADGSQLVAGALRPESPWVGKQIQRARSAGPWPTPRSSPWCGASR